MHNSQSLLTNILPVKDQYACSKTRRAYIHSPTRLQIPVYDPCRVHPLQPSQKLVYKILIVLVRKGLLRFYNLCQIRLHEPFHNVQFVEIFGILIIGLGIDKLGDLFRVEHGAISTAVFFGCLSNYIYVIISTEMP